LDLATFCGGIVQKKVSRRAFLQITALSSVAGAAMGNELGSVDNATAPSRPAPSTFGPQAVPLAITVNGKSRTVQVEPRMTLAELLRGPLQLTGTKIACNRGACSACTVLLDGVPVCSCMTLVIDVGARNVTTIEGLADGDALNPIQEAFIEHDAIQCGFCTPGMVMSCTALLQHNAHPSAEQVKAAISGHYCRCGTYPHVVSATLAAAKVKKV
jgi:aerobic-type carbon monoxide dehydrogenase small subunit (CoxS/CutS family)